MVTRAAPLPVAPPRVIVGYMPWDPMRDLLTMQERLESLFGRSTPGWMPPVDLSELPDRYVLTVEVCGLAREDVKIDFRDQMLTVRGERPAGQPCPERYQQLERGQGTFSRTFRFSALVAADAITADMADGVLTIALPKIAQEAARIPIEIEPTT
jgi:HSP20 family protein